MATCWGLQLLVLAVWSYGAQSLTAYDCQHPDVNETVVDLLSPPACAPPENRPLSRTVQARVLHAHKYHRVHVFTCRAEEKSVRTNTRTSHTDSTKVVTSLSRVDCQSLHLGHPYSSNGKTVLVKSNSTNSQSLQKNELCEHNYDYYSGNMCHYNETLTVTIADFWVSVSRDEGFLRFPSGMVCSYALAYCGGLQEGVAFWDLVPEDDCHPEGAHGFDVLYEGLANLTRPSGEDHTYAQYGNMAFRLANQTKLCADQAFVADEGRTVVVVSEVGGNFSSPVSTLPSAEENENSRKETEEAARLTWIAFTRAQSDREQRQLSAFEECLQDREFLRARMALARSSPDPVAVLLPDAQGVLGVVAGDVLHLKQCVAVEAELRNATRCYQHVPILVGGVEAFMASPGSVVVPAGMEVPCDPSAPVMHRVEGVWYVFDPAPRVASEAPRPLSFTVMGGVPVPEFRAGRPAGLGFSVYRDMFLNAAAMTALGGDSKGAAASKLAGSSATAMFSEADYAVIAEHTVSGVQCSVHRIAVVVSLFISVAVVVVAVKVVAQAYLIHHALGRYNVKSRALVAMGALSPGCLFAHLLRRKALANSSTLSLEKRDALLEVIEHIQSRDQKRRRDLTEEMHRPSEGERESRAFVADEKSIL